MDVDNIITIVIFAIWIIQAIAKAAKKGQQAPAPPPEPYPEPEYEAEPEPVPAPRPAPRPAPVPVPPRRSPAPVPRPAPAGGSVSAAERMRGLLAEAVADKARQARELAAEVRHERANRRFFTTLDEWVPAQVAAIQADLAAGALPPPQAARALSTLEMVLEEIRTLVRQRRDPALRPRLGDADALADACYRPVIEFARAEGLPITSNEPATQLGEFDLAIWTGFIPTSVAPIFLPPRFFDRVAWWPALAHEIGHDFQASVEGLSSRLRDELRVVPEDYGTRPLAMGPEGLTIRELERVLGGWFEELFADVFGTLMCGTGYVATMSELFAARHDPREILAVEVDASGRRYDTHPPRHLRLVAACRVLDLAGLGAEARRLREAWEARHGAADQPLDRILFPAAGGYLAVPLAPLEQMIGALVERLYAGPLDALAGFGLSDVSGLDYGPHEHQMALRARDALAGGRVPSVTDPRAIITGAVLATQASPEAEARILANARAAIPGRGTAEHRLDGFSTAADQAQSGVVHAPSRADGLAGELRDAVVLRSILDRPRTRRRR